MKRFLYSASVESVSGYQTFYIDAESREEADERAAAHDTDGIYWEEVEVQDLARLSFDDETHLDDFGQFPPAKAAEPTTVSDALLVDLFYAAQGDITQFRIKARELLGG